MKRSLYEGIFKCDIVCIENCLVQHSLYGDIDCIKFNIAHRGGIFGGYHSHRWILLIFVQTKSYSTFILKGYVTVKNLVYIKALRLRAKGRVFARIQ